ncbi:hypothetical protein MKW94_018615 [Papaver nudicaule]|uniref:Uncharacterized protein n=1 Tax=Papaver nudicaule TaxID=74823 RepID=A0AA41VHK2_PAPNU|nr:hypothetical protein [Papaver nudicaule]
MAQNITAEDIRNWHFKRMVVEGKRNLVMCMHVIAFWIVLEQFGFPNIVQRLLQTDNFVVCKIMDEAILCMYRLQWVTSEPMVNVHDMPLTQELVGGKPINCSMLHTSRETILTKLNKTVFESLAIGFEDIIQEVSGMTFARLNVQPLVIFTPSALMPAGGSTSAVESTNPNHTLFGMDGHLPDTKRGIFFTFTRENPVQREELESFLEGHPKHKILVPSLFGVGCIQKVTLQPVPENSQPLWASVVFYSEIPVHAIMEGRETAPITINGKKAWAGKEWL